ncbi:KilA-N domain-containing protein [Sphingobacterium sp. N143]|uniref:KilA-N domain-containing protein n=1 Tax=Sphingobacterium sp. N143 TaxID=2746727 RepID=UPI002578626E|nr:KilA-N domain-containing protein [Sphingobacterium sp. N143]MDM1294326.1 KilA-N domain-containing protein [Sphingobacterium sp. N143]
MLKLTVQDKDITLLQVGDEVYVSLTDIVKGEEGDDHIKHWMRNRNTIEFLGLWEQLNNPNFKGAEFDTFKKEAGLNSFNMSPKKWVESTDAIGVVSKAGRTGGGTFAHKDIALEFCTWLSPMFKLLVLKEFQRLKELTEIQGKWDIRRYLSKVNYKIQTDAIKDTLIPLSNLPKEKEGILYANEADLIYVAMYGHTSKQWREKNPELCKGGLNIRDYANTHELIVLANLENLNSNMIKNGKSQGERLLELRKEAISQKKSLTSSVEPDHKLIESPLKKYVQKKLK